MTFHVYLLKMSVFWNQPNDMPTKYQQFHSNVSIWTAGQLFSAFWMSNDICYSSNLNDPNTDIKSL